MRKPNISNNMDNFFKYMSKPLSPITIDLIYTSNNIVFERANLYCNFMRTLNELITSTYLGDEFTDSIEQNNHFNWCWQRSCELLNHNHINFNINKGAYSYFREFYFQTFYPLENKETKTMEIDKIGKIWEYIFDCNLNKSRSDLDSFVSLYKIFEKSYEKV